MKVGSPGTSWRPAAVNVARTKSHVLRAHMTPTVNGVSVEAHGKIIHLYSDVVLMTYKRDVMILSVVEAMLRFDNLLL